MEDSLKKKNNNRSVGVRAEKSLDGVAEAIVGGRSHFGAELGHDMQRNLSLTP